MAKSSNQRITGVRTSTLAMYQGVFAGVVGLGVAILYSLRNTVEMASATESVLTGLTFGVATGIVAILIVPLLYFALGWIVGAVQGFIFNVIAETSGGIVVRVQEDKDK